MRLKKFWAVLLALAALLIGLPSGTPLTPVASAGTIISLRDYYPNTTTIGAQAGSPTPQYASYYLMGNNYINPAAPFPANLWTRWQAFGSPTSRIDFALHNSGPGGDPNPECSKDFLNWKIRTAVKGLFYTGTDWRCAPNYMSRIKYDGVNLGIQFLPLTWDDASVCATDPVPGDGFPCSWTNSGTLTANYYEGTNSSNLVLKCTGTMNWIAQIHGYMQYSNNPPLTGIHWSTIQTTNWTGGPGAGTGCGPGQTTNWREDYVFADGMPVWSAGTTAKGLKRHWGGNTNGVGNWDIWYDGYAQVPAWTTLPALPSP